MLLAFTFILLAIWIGILVSVYSIFFPFIKNLGEIGNYNTAYYGAISSVERGELALKYREPGFEGTGGYLTGELTWWPQSDMKPSNEEEFGFLSNDPNGMRWTIKSRTTNIPNTGKGNVEYLVATDDSTDYNMLNYSSTEKIILSYDSTSDPQEYYTEIENIEYYTGDTLAWTLRLPPKVIAWFNNELLCNTCDLDEDRLGDDVVVDRSLEGYKEWMYFKVAPYIDVLYYSWSSAPGGKDTAIRETIINKNEAGNLNFGNNNFNPISKSKQPTSHIAIANTPENITETFIEMLWNKVYTWLALNLWLINLLKTSNGNIYPFLEYQFTTSAPIADRFYTIQGNSRVGDYEVKVVVKKPTSQWSIAGSFTVIF